MDGFLLVDDRDGRVLLEIADPIEAFRLLDELRLLLAEAEAWARHEGGEAGAEAVGKLRAALARDMIGV